MFFLLSVSGRKMGGLPGTEPSGKPPPGKEKGRKRGKRKRERELGKEEAFGFFDAGKFASFAETGYFSITVHGFIFSDGENR